MSPPSPPQRPLPALYPADLLLAGALAALALFVLISSPPVAGGPAIARDFALAAAGVVLARLLAARYQSRLLGGAADLAPIIGIPLIYLHLGPLVDRLHPGTLDPALMRAELALFGGHISLLLQPLLNRTVTEILYLAYITYYFWPMILGVILVAGGRELPPRVFGLAITISCLINYLGYVLVPAVGPRFTLADQYTVPLQGLWLAGPIEAHLRAAPFIRDCFPSGHTGQTLVTLWFARRYAPRFFRLMLPVAVLLITATIWCRFHYLVDLLAALPMVAASIIIPARLSPLIERGWRLPSLAGLRPHGDAGAPV